MPSARVTITRFARETLELGSLKISVLKPREVIVEKLEGDVLETLARVSENEASREDVAYVVAEIAGAGARLVYGDTRLRDREKQLFPRPARLARVGVVKIDALKFDPKIGAIVFKEDSVEWHQVGEEVYVIDARLEASGDVAFVILETDLGRTAVKMIDFSKTELFSQLQERQAEESPLGESESSGESSPA